MKTCFGGAVPCVFNCDKVCRRMAYSKRPKAQQEEAGDGDFLLEAGGLLLAE